MKKLISIAAIVLISLTLNSPVAYAYQEDIYNYEEALLLATTLDITAELHDASEGIIDTEVCQDVLDRISITSSDDNDIVFTVKHLGSISKGNDGSGEVYALTAASLKTTNNTTTEDNVDCWISMTWIDNLGPSNEIVSVSGGWNGNGRTLSNRQVFCGVVGVHGEFLNGQYEFWKPNEDSFDYTPSTSLIGLSLRAYSWVDSAGYPLAISCEVWPTIFD